MFFIDEQLQLICFLQQWRGPIVDWLFRFLNVFDTNYYISSLIAFIWIGCSWRWGVRLGFLVIASGWVNAMAKLTFALPRPFHIDPTLAIVQLHDYGFPSGGAQNAMIIGCLIIYLWKSCFAWPVGIFYILLISFSRVFLGVHFPVDVLGGWCLGAVIFFAFIQTYRRIGSWATRRPEAALGICLAIVLAISCFFHDFKTVFLMTSLTAMSVGVYFSTRYTLYFDPPRSIGKIFGLGIFGIFSAVCVALITWALLPSTTVQIVASGLWISLAASPFCQKVFGIR
ncbi:MAG: sepP [Parachlamydiales bacterium]|nr:sepP [Parachlamydiales bacterium]